MPTGQLLTAPEVAAILHVHVRHVWRLTAEGHLPRPVRFGRRSTRWRLSDLEAWIEQQGATGGAG